MKLNTVVRYYTGGQVSDRALREVAIKAGGYTRYSTRGGWINPDTRALVEEDGTVVEVIMPSVSASLVLVVTDIIKGDAKDRGEHSILVTAAEAWSGEGKL